VSTDVCGNAGLGHHPAPAAGGDLHVAIKQPSVIWIVPCVALPGDMARSSPSTSWNFRPVPSPGQSRNSATVMVRGNLLSGSCMVDLPTAI
jgi:hypothetical protein